MLSLPFRFCYAAISLQLEVGPIIIWLVIGGFTCLQYKWGDVVGLEKMCDPIIEVSVMYVKEEDLWSELTIYTGPTEKTHCLHPAIPIHIPRRRTVHLPVTGEVPLKILGVIFSLVHNHRWHEALAISSGEDQSSTPEGGSLSCLGFPNALAREELVGTD